MDNIPLEFIWNAYDIGQQTIIKDDDLDKLIEFHNAMSVYHCSDGLSNRVLEHYHIVEHKKFCAMQYARKDWCNEIY